MKHMTILVPEGENNLSSIVGAYKIFSRANAYYRERGKTDVFKIELAGLSTEVGFYGGLFSAKPHKSVSKVRKTDLIIVPSLNHNYDLAIKVNKELIDWISAQYTRGSCIASICTGAYLLAEAGLLNGKSCSTHWLAADALKKRYPEIKLEADKLVTDELGIYTNGGAYSFLNLILYLVEKYYDRETAIFCSKVFQIEIDRNSQSEYMIFNGQRSHQDELVKKAQFYIEHTLDEKFSVEQLAQSLAVGRRSFDRRFIKATGNTPLEYAQRVRAEAAKRAFETTKKTVNEVMFDVGYTDVKAFREMFRRITGLSPLDYRSRFNKVLN